MGLERIDVSPEHYVVLDVETTGVNSRLDDLLSISMYKPDDGKQFDRFLPLERCESIPAFITQINGITDADLEGLAPLSQDEVDRLYADFELDRRTILHYGTLDEYFIRDYFRRHGLRGYTRMRFLNFKRLIHATGFSDGSLTKDNLCLMFGIDGVRLVHSGANDCVLEWKLFEKIGGRHVIAVMGPRGWSVEALSPDYIVPVSRLATYTHLSDLYPRPRIGCEAIELRRLCIRSHRIRRFRDTFSGETVEHLIDTMLDAREEDNLEFLRANRAKNEHLGAAPHQTEYIPMSFEPDGTVKALNKKDRRLERQLNATLLELKDHLAPLVDHIRDDIFHGKPIKSQELVVNHEQGILALCDLSTDDAVLEIKTSSHSPEHYAEQLHYEANGRKAYLLTMEWPVNAKDKPEGIDLHLWETKTHPLEATEPTPLQGKALVTKALEERGCELVEYFTSKDPILVRCKTCGHEWSTRYATIRQGRLSCGECHPKTSGRKARAHASARMSPEEALRTRAARYALKVSDRSDGTLLVDTDTYTGSRDNVKVACTICGYDWTARTDRLLAACFCPRCRKTALPQ